MMGELSPLAALELVCGEIFDRWDKDQRSGKLLTALSGHMAPGYDPRVDLIREALSRRPDAPSAGEWMPIETAPKDGTPILGWSDEGVAYVCWAYWATECGGCWRFFDTGKGDTYAFYPTHWRPLPAQPQADGGEG